MKKASFALAGSIAALAAAFPLAAYAQTNANLSDVISGIIYYLNQALVLLMALAVVLFVWYVIKYFIRDDSDAKARGNYILWSVIGFFAILSLWGIVNVLSNTFGLGNSANQPQSWESFSNIFPK